MKEIINIKLFSIVVLFMGISFLMNTKIVMAVDCSVGMTGISNIPTSAVYLYNDNTNPATDLVLLGVTDRNIQIDYETEISGGSGIFSKGSNLSYSVNIQGNIQVGKNQVILKSDRGTARSLRLIVKNRATNTEICSPSLAIVPQDPLRCMTDFSLLDYPYKISDTRKYLYANQFLILHGVKTDVKVDFIPSDLTIGPQEIKLIWGDSMGSADDYFMEYKGGDWLITTQNNGGEKIPCDECGVEKIGSTNFRARLPGWVFNRSGEWKVRIEYLKSNSASGNSWENLCNSTSNQVLYSSEEEFVFRSCGELESDEDLFYNCTYNIESQRFTLPGDSNPPKVGYKIPDICKGDMNDPLVSKLIGYFDNRKEAGEINNLRDIYNLQSVHTGSKGLFCFKQIKLPSGVTTKKVHGDICSSKNDLECNSQTEFSCRKKLDTSDNNYYCLYNIGINDKCIPKTDECDLSEHNFCKDGKCSGPAECVVNNEYVCESLKENDPNAFCDENSKKCVYSKAFLSSVGAKDPDVMPSPVIPAPPSRFIERCKGDLSCVNCVARATIERPSGLPSYAEFPTSKQFISYSEAVALEYVYNQKVDEWKEARSNGNDYVPAPKPTGFVYTGYIYTSLGCIDTTDNGLITRVVQIALGVIGSVILVRFAQAALKFQGGSSPEDKAEGIEIVTSAIVALLLFVMSMIVLRFIGVDLFQIFSPGSFEIG